MIRTYYFLTFICIISDNVFCQDIKQDLYNSFESIPIDSLDHNLIEFEGKSINSLAEYLEKEFENDVAGDVKLIVDPLDYDGLNQLKIQYGSVIVYTSINEIESLNPTTKIINIYSTFQYIKCPYQTDSMINDTIYLLQVIGLNPSKKIFMKGYVRHHSPRPKTRFKRCPNYCLPTNFILDDGERINLLWGQIILDRKQGIEDDYQLYKYNIERNIITEY